MQGALISFRRISAGLGFSPAQRAHCGERYDSLSELLTTQRAGVRVARNDSLDYSRLAKNPLVAGMWRNQRQD